MPTNHQRREAAKRKLQRQLERREKEQRARRQRLTIIGVVAAVLVVSGAVWLISSNRSDSADGADGGADATTSATETAPTEPATPCTYTDAPPAARDVTPPQNLSPLNSGTVDVEVTLNGAAVPITLDRALAPCGVNSFVSLASQGFYDDTTCHRLTVSPALNILQCGDPTGAGNGGPGYSFDTEAATDATYPVGTVALANAGGVNGSQFFIVYGESTLPASYTILGEVTGDGMAVIEGIAEGGTENGGQSGTPATTATIETVSVPQGALEGTGTYPTASEESPLPTDLPPSEVVPTGSAADESPPSDASQTATSDAATSTGGAG